MCRGAPGTQAAAVSPVRNCLCAQDDLEPVLRGFAEQQGPGELRFSTEAVTFEQDADGVTSTLADRSRRREGDGARALCHRRRRRP